MANKQIIVQKGRTNVLRIDLGYDVSQDTFESEIRVDKNRSSELIATWEASFETDGTDGKIILTLDDLVTGQIDKSVGYMDVKRITGGEPVSVFDSPLEVVIRETVTA
jgi:hypothetical protein